MSSDFQSKIIKAKSNHKKKQQRKQSTYKRH